MNDIRTTIILRDPKEVGFVQKIRSEYPSMKEAAIIKVMIRVGINALLAMGREELQAELLRG